MLKHLPRGLIKDSGGEWLGNVSKPGTSTRCNRLVTMGRRQGVGHPWRLGWWKWIRESRVRHPWRWGLGTCSHPWRWGRRHRVLVAGRWCAVGVHVVPENVPEGVYSRDLRCGWGGGGISESGLGGMQGIEEFVFKSQTG